MGELIMMPSRNVEDNDIELESKPAVVSVAAPQIDFSVWLTAPKERTLLYFPVYSAVSRAMQAAMRGWVAEWFQSNMEVLTTPHTAYPILVYQCTHPFSGKPTNIFTYDIQQTDALDRAFASAAWRMGRLLSTINTKSFPWFTREYYFAYRGKEVVKYVSKNRRALHKMLNVETMLMNSILKFAIIDIPKLGLEKSIVLLRRAFETQLNRFSKTVDLSCRADELLRIMTDAMMTKLANEAEVLLAA